MSKVSSRACSKGAAIRPKIRNKEVRTTLTLAAGLGKTVQPCRRCCVPSELLEVRRASKASKAWRSIALCFVSTENSRLMISNMAHCTSTS